MSRPVLYLIDGSSYIFRAYFAVRNLSTSKGFPTNALYGFTSMIFKFLKDYKPDYVGIVFDSKGLTFRSEIYPEYKANRGEPPEDLKPQFPKIFEMVDAFLIPLVQMEGFEADDLIGTIAKFNEEKGIDVVLVTGDKDFYQIVSEKITLIDTMKDSKTGIQEVKEKYGVRPDQIIDFLALTGDSIDNIPGVKGIGQKTASMLISTYDNLDNLYDNLENLKPRIKKLLEENKENAYLSRKLVTIKTDVLVNTDLSSFKFNGFNTDKLSSMFNEYEFKNLFRELGEDGNLKRVDFNNDSVVNYDDYELVLDVDEFNDVISFINSTNELSIDLETTSRLPMEAKIVGFALTPAGGKAYYIPVGHINIDENTDQLNIEKVIDKLKPVLEDPSIKKIGQNLKYESVVLRNYDIELKGIFFDTIIAAHLLDSSLTSYKLDKLSKLYLGHTMISYDDVTGKGKDRINFSEVELDLARKYACEDSDIAFLLYKKLFALLKENNLLDVYQNKLIKYIDVLSDMEFTGVKIDIGFLKNLSEEFQEKLDGITNDIYITVGNKFNINSPLQLRKVLFEQLNLPSRKKTKKGEPSTDSEVLKDLSKFHEVPDLILKHRALTKLKSTYVDSLPRLVNPKTNKIHTSFHPVGTSTGRLSSSDPNLQNIPIKTEDGRRIRKAFISEENYSILSADYSQIELRLLAHFSKDETLIEAFKQDQDIHRRTASEIFNVTEDEVTSEMRRLAKNINFGIIYGISSYGLSRQLGTSVSISKEYMDKYFNKYSKVKDYMDASIRDAQNKGYSETIIGRRRPIKELESKNSVQRGFGERAAINTPIQGSAADIINISMIGIFNKLQDKYKSKMILQVHDELLFEVYDKELEGVSQLIKTEMESAWELRVPLKVDIGVGKNWAEAH